MDYGQNSCPNDFFFKQKMFPKDQKYPSSWYISPKNYKGFPLSAKFLTNWIPNTLMVWSIGGAYRANKTYMWQMLIQLRYHHYRNCNIHFT